LAGTVLAVWCATLSDPVGPWPLIGVLIGTALSLGGVYVALSGRQGIVLTRMVLLVLVPLMVLGGLLSVLAVTFVSAEVGATGNKLTPALVAGIAVALGWIAAPLTQELRRSDEREERRRDMIEACAEEVWLIGKFAANLDIEEVIAGMQRAFALDNQYKVFVLYRREFSTLKRLVEQIEILTQQQIGPIMNYHQLLSRLDQIEEKMGGDAFSDLPRTRRENAVVLYYRLLATVPAESVTVLNALDRPQNARELQSIIDEKIKEFTPQTSSEGGVND
jgi:hypothetical protein